MNDPNKSFVNLTYKCNSNCVSCIMENHYQDRDISFSEICKKINGILSRSNHIEFNGGEPTLRKDVFKILDYTNKAKPNVEIGLISNARIFSNKANVDRLKELGLGNFKVVTSIYGHDAKLHDAITRTPGSFKQQIDGIKNLISDGFNVELRIIINKINSTHLDKMADFISNNFRNSNFIQVVFVNMKIYGIALDNKDLVTYKVGNIIDNLKLAVEILDSKGFKVKLYHFPFCIISKNLWKFTEGVTAEKSEISFLSSCEYCSKYNQCSGIWNGYLKLFEGHEFLPIRKTTENYFLKLYFDKNKYYKAKLAYKIFKDNSIPLANISFSESNAESAVGQALSKNYGFITLHELYMHKLKFKSDVFDFIINILKKMNNILKGAVPIEFQKEVFYRDGLLQVLLKKNIVPVEFSQIFSKLTSELVFSHGDFQHNNIILNKTAKNLDNNLKIIDVDDASLNTKFYDLANFLFYSNNNKFADLFFKRCLLKNYTSQEDVNIIQTLQIIFLDDRNINLNKDIENYIKECVNLNKFILHDEVMSLIK